MAKIKSRIHDEPTSQFTSMIDIVFLLLIFFILQPFKAPELKIASELPQTPGIPKESDIQPRLNINMEIIVDPLKADHAIYKIDGRQVGNTQYGDQKKLPYFLTRTSRGRTDTPVAIRAEPKVLFQHVLAVLDACYKAKMPDVNWSAPEPSYVPAYMRGSGR